MMTRSPMVSGNTREDTATYLSVQSAGVHSSSSSPDPDRCSAMNCFRAGKLMWPPDLLYSWWNFSVITSTNKSIFSYTGVSYNQPHNHYVWLSHVCQTYYYCANRTLYDIGQHDSTRPHWQVLNNQDVSESAAHYTMNNVWLHTSSSIQCKSNWTSKPSRLFVN